MTIKVYNILSRDTKTVNINLPEESEDGQKVSLGILVREEEYPKAHERVLRIAEVYPRSPAAFAGLMPSNDYIIDCPQYPFANLEQFANVVQAVEEKRDPKGLEICVYNAKNNTTRLTKIYPNKRWGGKGALGCEFSLGLLNHLPEIKPDEDDDIIIPKARAGENFNHNNNLDLEMEKINVVTIDDSSKNYDEFYEGILVDEGKSQKLLKRIGDVLQEKETAKASTTATTSFQNLLIETGNDSKNSIDHHDEQTTPIFELQSSEKEQADNAILEEHHSPDFPNRTLPIGSPINAENVNTQQSKPGPVKQFQAQAVQKSSIRAMPRPQVRSRNAEASISHSISGISDISPITKASPSEQYAGGFPRKFFPSPGVQRKTSFSNTQVTSLPQSPRNLNTTIKEEVSVFYPSSSTAKKTRRYTSDNMKSERNNHGKNNEDEVVETYFQGFERVEHLEDEPQGFPKILLINTQEHTNMTTTILDKSGVESVNKSFDIVDTYEKPICKTVMKYAFQSKKLGGEYIIKSTDLFNIEDFKKM